MSSFKNPTPTKIHNNSLRKISRRNFWWTKWNTSTALYNILYNKKLQKWSIIPADITNRKNTKQWNINKYKESINSHFTLSASQALWDFFPQEFQTITQEHDFNAKNINFNVLKCSYLKTYTKELLNLLLHHTSFYTDMFQDEQNLELLQKYLSTKNYQQIPEDQIFSIIRFQQLYQKFNVQDNNIDKLTVKDIINKKYNVENYIDNLLFAEYITKILWIWDSQTLIIKDTSYKIYVSSLQQDIYHGWDIFLEDEWWNTIWIDITLYKKTISWKSPKKSLYFNNNIIINYMKYNKYFQNFASRYKDYIFNKWAIPDLYSEYTFEAINEFEERIHNIIQSQNSTPFSPDPDKDNNDVKD